ncbi:hypothetical protein NMY22_g4302 [Coprinellus aureogranulatus]|nr:hypothetical protein NMY22_g4302 [Coprinellus aureogranulatus]
MLYDDARRPLGYASASAWVFVRHLSVVISLVLSSALASPSANTAVSESFQTPSTVCTSAPLSSRPVRLDYPPIFMISPLEPSPRAPRSSAYGLN